MVLSYSFVAVIVLAGIALFCLVKWRLLARTSDELRRSLELSELTITASLGGFYHWSAVTQKEEFSLNLVKMFNLRRDIDTFEKFAELLGYDKDVFLHSLSDLRSGKQPRFLFNSKAKVSGHERYFQCVGNRIDDEQGQIIGIVVWFFDVSDYILRLKNVIDENNAYKEKVENYANMLNALPFPVWQYDKHAMIRYYNLMYARFVDDGQARGENDQVPELDPELKTEATKVIEQKRAYHGKRHLVVEGERRYFEVVELPLNNNRSVLSFARDITKQEELEKELESHISAHADLLESSSSAMAIYGRDTKLKFYNNAFVKLWGLSEHWLSSNPTYGEILEQLRRERKLPEQVDFQRFRERQLQLFKELIKPFNEFFYLPDGKSLRAIVIPHALGGLLFAYEDMTDHLAMESSYNTLIAVQRETLDNLSEGVLVVGQDGRVKLYNPVYTKIWPEALPILDKLPHLADILDLCEKAITVPEDWKHYKARVIAEISERVSHVRRIERKDGRVIKRISIPLPDGATLVSFVDITDSTLVERSLRERNEALEGADKLKTEFLANVSYELRTPLTSIMGFAEALGGEFFGRLNKQQKEYVQYIHDSSSQLMTLINDILDVASMEAGYLTLDIEKFDICKALSLIAKLLSQHAKDVGLQIELHCDKAIGSMFADERRFKQIIFNLLSNAIKFTESGGKIVVEAKSSGKDEVVIVVEDTGIGIAKEEQGKVFDKFFKSEEAWTLNRSGTGLGLSVVKSIIEMHGGSISVESEKGKGTRVECRFRRSGPPVDAKPNKSSNERLLGKK